MFAKGFVAPGRRCVKRGKTQRPSFSCVGTEWEAGNGFKEKKKKRKYCQCKPQPFSSFEVLCFFFFLREVEARSECIIHFLFCMPGILPTAAPRRPACSIEWSWDVQTLKGSHPVLVLLTLREVHRVGTSLPPVLIF